MLKSATKGLTATKLQVILIAMIVLLLGLSAAGFWYFQGFLANYATQVQTANANASSSASDVSRLKQLEQELEDDKVAVTRAQNIVADSKYYKYQDQIITDITAYAKASGVTITGFTFDTAGGTGTSGGSSGSSASGQQPAAAPLAAPAGLKSISAQVNIKTPVDYEAIMRFIHAIEINLTKMQIAGVSLQRTDGSEDISVNPITIEVYTTQ